MKTINDRDPQCPKCDSYDVTPVPPEKKLTGDWRGICNMCGHEDNWDMFFCCPAERLVKAIYGN
jgi:hypothetical protein